MKKSIKEVRAALLEDLKPQGIEFVHEWWSDGMGGELLRSRLNMESRRRLIRRGSPLPEDHSLEDRKAKLERLNEYDWLATILRAGGLLDATNYPTVSDKVIECPDREAVDAG